MWFSIVWKKGHFSSSLWLSRRQWLREGGGTKWKKQNIKQLLKVLKPQISFFVLNLLGLVGYLWAGFYFKYFSAAQQLLQSPFCILFVDWEDREFFFYPTLYLLPLSAETDLAFKILWGKKNFLKVLKCPELHWYCSWSHTPGVNEGESRLWKNMLQSRVTDINLDMKGIFINK